ncbi:glutamine amidotransferase [Pseudohoeflea sp. DP4N28-3]|uniref:Glutamine amidotransferase n=1 Tax=Pseudohoeflea coraliihabitans TaxID=2860393 RepID=A0ABS6WLE4_9HYPH|nr:glutamine amidotransferase [Pseudohoeflea sp. DP4N28-3]MBW3096787.1 glutamine amidotransferase [Pseudohoeflea sp. DP4N28-3]
MEVHAPPRAPSLLVVLHQETSSPGRVGQLLVEMGYQLDIRRPVLGDPLPASLEGHAGAVVFGGPMSANDDVAGIHAESRWMEVVLKSGKPFLGICLGAQILARYLGARVYGREDGHVEIGWYPLQATEAGQKLMDWPDIVYQFHREGFDLPTGAELLATAELYPNQAFRYGDNAWGVQFHAELTLAMMTRWTVRGARRFSLPGAQQGAQHLSGRMLHDAALLTWLKLFLDKIFGRAQSPPSRIISRSLSSD